MRSQQLLNEMCFVPSRSKTLLCLSDVFEIRERTYLNMERLHPQASLVDGNGVVAQRREFLDRVLSPIRVFE